MPLRLRRLLVGRSRSRYRWTHWLPLVVVLFLATFAAYAFDLFTIAGGVVFVPGQAALVGAVAACLVGYARGGLVVAWSAMFASLLGYRADHAFLGLSYRPFPGRLAYFLDPEGLFVFAVEALVLGVPPFIAGALVRRGVDAFRGGTDAPAADSE